MSAKTQAKYQGPCRMSWFLVEMAEGQSKGGEANGKIVYDIIHSMELIDYESTNMYINRKVRFNRNHAIIEGRIKLASDDRYFVEKQLKDLTKNNEVALLNKNLSRRFLVQYNKGANSIVHAIVSQKEIVWPKGDIHNSPITEIVIRDGKIHRMASVLYTNNSDDLLRKELNALKTHCFEKAFKDPNYDLNIEEAPWLLVQYSNGPSNVSYTIINLKDTVWKTKNLYPNVVAYFVKNESVFQAIILRKSKSRCELNKELSLIKNSCVMTEFPLT